MKKQVLTLIEEINVNNKFLESQLDLCERLEHHMEAVVVRLTIEHNNKFINNLKTIVNSGKR